MNVALALLPLLVAAVAAQPQTLSLEDRLHGPSSQPFEGFRVIDNIYYVGATGISAHVIATPAGLILLDTGTEQMLPVIRANVEKLGFRMQDIKIILASHAHFDHVEGHAAMKALTGAQVMALGEDAAALESGKDLSAAALVGWKPTRVDRVLKDLDTVTLGGVTLRAHHTPGHTKGCTTWTMTVHDGGKTLNVVFVGGTGINEGVKLVGNTRHQSIIEDYARTFQKLKELRADVFLAQHPATFGMEEKLRRLKAGASPNPFIDPAGYKRLVEDGERAYRKQLAEERAITR
jgi:metallo-beta-lactamase class B